MKIFTCLSIASLLLNVNAQYYVSKCFLGFSLEYGPAVWSNPDQRASIVDVFAKRIKDPTVNEATNLRRTLLLKNLSDLTDCLQIRIGGIKTDTYLSNERFITLMAMYRGLFENNPKTAFHISLPARNVLISEINTSTGVDGEKNQAAAIVRPSLMRSIADGAITRGYTYCSDSIDSLGLTRSCIRGFIFGNEPDSRYYNWNQPRSYKALYNQGAGFLANVTRFNPNKHFVVGAFMSPTFNEALPNMNQIATKITTTGDGIAVAGKYLAAIGAVSQHYYGVSKGDKTLLDDVTFNRLINFFTTPGSSGLTVADQIKTLRSNGKPYRFNEAGGYTGGSGSFKGHVSGSALWSTFFQLVSLRYGVESVFFHHCTDGGCDYASIRFADKKIIATPTYYSQLYLAQLFDMLGLKKGRKISVTRCSTSVDASNPPFCYLKSDDPTGSTNSSSALVVINRNGYSTQITADSSWAASCTNKAQHILHMDRLDDEGSDSLAGNVYINGLTVDGVPSSLLSTRVNTNGFTPALGNDGPIPKAMLSGNIVGPAPYTVTAIVCNPDTASPSYRKAVTSPMDNPESAAPKRIQSSAVWLTMLSIFFSVFYMKIFF